MDFYTRIAEQYHHIFPLNPQQVLFTNQSFSDKANTSILEAGCGVGLLSLELAKTYQKVVGIDLDEKMLLKAKERKFREKGNHQPEFLCLNMLHILERFGSLSFNGILCFGNTIVHLETDDQVLDFFTQCRKVLKSGGKFLFQILNYDRILDKKITSLPLTENEFVRFERSYRFFPDADRIDFTTRLFIKENSQLIENCISLYPLRSDKVDMLLRRSGFSTFTFFGDYQRTPFDTDSEILVVEAICL